MLPTTFAWHMEDNAAWWRVLHLWLLCAINETKYVIIKNSVYKIISVSNTFRKRCKRLIPCFFTVQELEKGRPSSLSQPQLRGKQRVLDGHDSTEHTAAMHQIRSSFCSKVCSFRNSLCFASFSFPPWSLSLLSFLLHKQPNCFYNSRSFCSTMYSPLYIRS